MKTKRITYLSELHKAIGNYLYEHGDAQIVSIATHNTSDLNDRRIYSIICKSLDRDPHDCGPEDEITINYHNVPVEENTVSEIKTIRPSFNGHMCECCGNPIYSSSATLRVCNECASEYKF